MKWFLYLLYRLGNGSSWLPSAIHLTAAKQDARLFSKHFFFSPSSSSLWIFAWLLSSGFFPGSTTDCQEKLRATAACLSLIIFSRGPYSPQIFLEMGNPLSGKGLSRLLAAAAVSAQPQGQEGGGLSSSLGSDTRCLSHDPNKLFHHLEFLFHHWTWL